MKPRDALLDALSTACEFDLDDPWLSHRFKGSKVTLGRYLDHQPDLNLFRMTSALGWVARRFARLAGGMDAEALSAACTHLGTDLVSDLEKRIRQSLVARGAAGDADLVLQELEQFAELSRIGLEDDVCDLDDDRGEGRKAGLHIGHPDRTSARVRHLVVPLLIGAAFGCLGAVAAGHILRREAP